jgi:hypothetical protein
MSLNSFSSLFEILAGLNLAFAGIDSFRRKVFDTLTDILTPLDVKAKLDELEPKIQALSPSIKDKIVDEKIKKRIVDIDTYYKDETRNTALEDSSFFNERAAFNPSYFIGFLFCLSNLLLIGYEQVFTEYSSTLVEQGLLIWLPYIFIIYISREGKFKSFLCNHRVIIGTFVFLLIVSSVISYFRLVLVEINTETVTITSSIVTGMLPFIFDYFTVRSYVKERSKKVATYIAKTNSELVALNTALELLTPLTDGKASK